jgi:hypothetical protein
MGFSWNNSLLKFSIACATIVDSCSDTIFDTRPMTTSFTASRKDSEKKEKRVAGFLQGRIFLTRL